jgi:signal transduction histidine kinase
MEHSDQDEFKARLSQVRHDLRTPIGHIIGYSELIEEEMDTETLSACSHDLQSIQNADQKMLAQIDHYFGDAKNSADELQIGDAQFQLRMQLNDIARYAEIFARRCVGRWAI